MPDYVPDYRGRRDGNRPGRQVGQPGGRQKTYVPRDAVRGLPSVEELTPHVPPGVWSQGLTAVTLQRIIALRRAGVNFTTICIGGLNLPQRIVERTYNKLPLHLR